MEIHKPKPAHGWRGYLSEIAIVVLGIVIALTGEKVVQRLETRAKVRHAEELMRFEFADDNGPQVYERLAVSPCIIKALSDLRAGIEQNQSRSLIEQSIAGFEPPRHSWDSVAFQSATVTNVLSEVPQERLWRWAFLYTVMPVLDRANEREFLDVGRLRALSAVGGPLSESERTMLLQAVEALRRDNAEIVAGADHAAAAMQELGIRVDVNTKLSEQIFSPGGAGPSRVIDNLKQLPMAASCVPTLRKMMHDAGP